MFRDDLSLSNRSGLPDALRVLVAEYPREGWRAHPNFGDLVAFWLEQHLLFRRLLVTLEADVQALIAREIGFDVYAPRLSRFVDVLVSELRAHHRMEDRDYFPRLVGIDRRVAAGFDLLGSDHQAIDALLNGFTGAAAEVRAGGAPGAFADHLAGFDILLDRHLVDEEEIVVPVILKSGIDG